VNCSTPETGPGTGETRGTGKASPARITRSPVTGRAVPLSDHGDSIGCSHPRAGICPRFFVLPTNLLPHSPSVGHPPRAPRSGAP
jgi:hypothetical protein